MAAATRSFLAVKGPQPGRKRRVEGGGGGGNEGAERTREDHHAHRIPHYPCVTYAIRNAHPDQPTIGSAQTETQPHTGSQQSERGALL